MPSVNVLVSAPLYPTESEEKVRKAILNIFPDAELNVLDKRIEGKSESMGRFREILKDLRIRDSARHHLMSRVKGQRIEFSISKQAAYVGKISFGGTNPALGEIEVIIESDSPEKLIAWLTFTGE